MAHNADCDRLLAIIDAQNEIIANELDLDAVMRLVTDRACTLTGADVATIELGDTGDAVRSAGPRIPGDEGAGASLSVPVRQGDAVLGTLKVLRTDGRFDTADEQALELLARLAAAHLALAARVGGRPAGDRVDEVTDLPNRRAYEQRLALEAERARRYRYPLALVRLEGHGLDAVASELGEPDAEAVLREIAELLNGSRFADEAFRIDACEFAILLPHTDLAGAEAAAARLVMLISTAAVAGGRVSATWGAASDEGHPAALHEGAGRALVAAKGGGQVKSTG